MAIVVYDNTPANLAIALATPAAHVWIDDTKIRVSTAPDRPQDQPDWQDVLDAAAVRQYAKLAALKNMTPAQVQAWVAANVTNLAQAQDAIATLAIAVGFLARRL